MTFSPGDKVRLKSKIHKTGIASQLALDTYYTVKDVSSSGCVSLYDTDGQYIHETRFYRADDPSPSSPANLPDTGERSDFDTGATRDACRGKGLPSLMPLDALRALSRRFEDGAAKYASRNWEKGIPLSRYVDSLYRHLWAFMEGDTSEDHGGAIIWNATCLFQTSEWIKQGRLPSDLDDLSSYRGYSDGT